MITSRDKNRNLNFNQNTNKRRKKRSVWRVLLLILIFILLIIIGLVLLFRMKRFQVASVEISGSTIVDKNAIVQKVDEYLNQSKFFVLPKSNTLLVPKSEILAAVLHTYPRLSAANLDIQKKGTDRKIILTVTDRNPYAIWCDQNTDIEASDVNCFFLDSDGLVFDKSPDFSGSAYFRYSGLFSTESSSTPIGSIYLSSSTKFKDLDNFINDVKKLSIHPTYLFARSEEEIELHVYRNSKSDTKILFTTSESYSKTLHRLELLLRVPDLSPKIGILDSAVVDMRYGNKVFYKKVDDESATSSVSASILATSTLISN